MQTLTINAWVCSETGLPTGRPADKVVMHNGKLCRVVNEYVPVKPKPRPTEGLLPLPSLFTDMEMN